MDTLLFLDFLDNSDKKARTVKARSNPFDEFDDAEFKIRFRLSKSTVKKLLEQVSVWTFSYTHYIKYNPVKSVNKYDNKHRSRRHLSQRIPLSYGGCA